MWISGNGTLDNTAGATVTAAGIGNATTAADNIYGPVNNAGNISVTAPKA